MSRINTNVQSLIAQHVVGRQTKALNASLERLGTGLKINAGKDNPAGLIASENLRAEKAGITQAIANAERANSMMGTAEGALNEVSALLVELQTLVTERANTGGLTQEEIDANQAQADYILDSIDRIARSTSFGGKALLDGSLSTGASFEIGAKPAKDEVAETSSAVTVKISAVTIDLLGKTDDGAEGFWYLNALKTDGALELADDGTDFADVQTVLTEAAKEVANLRGSLGAFQKYTLNPTINSLEVALENVSAAESAIRDTDFAAETSAMTRSQILVNAATNVLALANTSPQSVLSLLRG